MPRNLFKFVLSSEKRIRLLKLFPSFFQHFYCLLFLFPFFYFHRLFGCFHCFFFRLYI